MATAVESYLPDEESSNTWIYLIKSFTYEQLEELKSTFQSKDIIDNKKEHGLNLEEFQTCIYKICDGHGYNQQSKMLFEAINKSNKTVITWNDFLDFLLKNIETDVTNNVKIKAGQILAIPHTKRESIMKIVIIETDKYFCYAIATKHGRIGLYDGNLNFLISYHVIMTREDITRSEEDRRRRNRWITDAVYCPDVLMFIVTTSARSIVIYEASGLKHVPMWLILSTPNIIQSFSYKPLGTAYFSNESILFAGDDKGILMSFHFLQPKVGYLRKKHNDKLSLFYWEELKKEKDFILIKKFTPNHNGNCIKYLSYYSYNGSLVSCCEDSNCSIIQTFIDYKRKSNVFHNKEGALTFAMSSTLQILISGNSKGLISLWNPVIINRPIAVLQGHSSRIVDIQIFESQKLFFTCSSKGEFKMWDMSEQKCLQTINIKFPAFNIFGKLIEWGVSSIYPGPTRNTNYFLQDDENDCKTIEQEVPTKKLDIFENSHILVCCCNYISKIDLQFSDQDIQKKIDTPILPPPPLQNSVLIPNAWKIQDDDFDNETSPIEISTEKIEERLKELDFILERDLSTDLNMHTNINYKIATLETQKLEMKKNVARGAPYLALNLYNIEDLKLSDDLPIPSTKKAKYYSEVTRKLITEAENKDVIFSEPSSSRSKSSKSSIVEFP